VTTKPGDNTIIGNASGIAVTKNDDDFDEGITTVYDSKLENDVVLQIGDKVTLDGVEYGFDENDKFMKKVKSGGSRSCGGVFPKPRRIAAAIFCVVFALSGALLS
jgi:hypothetical protein